MSYNYDLECPRFTNKYLCERFGCAYKNFRCMSNAQAAAVGGATSGGAVFVGGGGGGGVTTPATSVCNSITNMDICKQNPDCRFIPPAKCVDVSSPEQAPSKEKVCPTVTYVHDCRGVYQCSWFDDSCHAPLPHEELLQSPGPIRSFPELVKIFRENDVNLAIQQIQALSDTKQLSEVQKAALFLSTHLDVSSDVQARMVKLTNAATDRLKELEYTPPPESPPESPPQNAWQTIWSEKYRSITIGIIFIVILAIIIAILVYLNTQKKTKI